MLLEIDSREPKSIKEAFSDINHEIKNLDQGDFIIKDSNNNPLIIFERKNINDLLSSVKDNRYREQSERFLKMEFDNHKIYYIIEGNRLNLDTNSIEFKTFYSCIFALSYKKGFSIILTNDVKETILIIEQFFNRLSKEKETDKNNGNVMIENENEKEKSEVFIKKPNATLENINYMMLSLIPGIGQSTAKEILSYFNNSIYNLITYIKETNKETNKESECSTYRKTNLVDIKINNRKLSKKNIENLKLFLK